MKKRALSLFLIMVLILGVLSVSGADIAQAALKKESTKIYSVNAQNISSFKKSDGKLLIKTDKRSIWKCSGNAETWECNYIKVLQNNVLTVEITKNCKWKYRDPNDKLSKITYAKIKKNVSNERKGYKKYLASKSKEEYETAFSLRFVLKNGKLMEVVAMGVLV